MVKSLMNQQKYRKILADVIAENINTFEPCDLFYEFTENPIVKTKVGGMGGDVFTNPKIQQIVDEGEALIEQALSNIQKFIKRELPLWIITQNNKEENK